MTEFAMKEMLKINGEQGPGTLYVNREERITIHGGERGETFKAAGVDTSIKFCTSNRSRFLACSCCIYSSFSLFTRIKYISTRKHTTLVDLGGFMKLYLKILFILFLVNYYATEYTAYNGTIISKVLAPIIAILFIAEFILSRKDKV